MTAPDATEVFWINDAPPPTVWGDPRREHAVAEDGDRIWLVVAYRFERTTQRRISDGDFSRLVADAPSDIAFQLQACAPDAEREFVRDSIDADGRPGRTLATAVARLATAADADALAVVWPLARHDAYVTLLQGLWVFGVVPAGVALAFERVRPSSRSAQPPLLTAGRHR